MCGILGPILDRKLFEFDTAVGLVTKNSKFYPYDVVAVLNNEKTRVDTYVIQAALAGITKDEIEIQITEDNTIKINVTPKIRESEYAKVIRSQISYAKKSIIFDLPKEVDLSKVTSKYVDGILYIYIPMNYVKSDTKSINID